MLFPGQTAEALLSLPQEYIPDQNRVHHTPEHVLRMLDEELEILNKNEILKRILAESDSDTTSSALLKAASLRERSFVWEEDFTMRMPRLKLSVQLQDRSLPVDVYLPSNYWAVDIEQQTDGEQAPGAIGVGHVTYATFRASKDRLYQTYSSDFGACEEKLHPITPHGKFFSLATNSTTALLPIEQELRVEIKAASNDIGALILNNPGMHVRAQIAVSN